MSTKHTVEVELLLERRVTIRMQVEVADIDEENCEDLTPDEIRKAARLADMQLDAPGEWEVVAVREVA